MQDEAQKKQTGGNTPSSKAWLLRQSKDEYAHRARKEGSPSRAIYKLEQIEKMLLERHRKRQNQKKGGRGSDESNRKHLFQTGNVVVDLGAAPGGWSMYASSQVRQNGMVIAVDLLPLDERALHQNGQQQASSVHAIQGDFKSIQVKNDIFSILMMHHAQKRALPDPAVDVVMSDMAANFTGDKKTDALKTMSLCEEALSFAIGLSNFHDTTITHHSIPTSSDEPSNFATIAGSSGILRPGGTFLCKFFSCGKEDEYDLMEAARRCFTQIDVLKPPASRRESAEQYLLATGYKGLA